MRKRYRNAQWANAIIIFAIWSFFGVPFTLLHLWWYAVMVWSVAAFVSAIPWFVYLERDGDALRSTNFGFTKELNIHHVDRIYRRAGFGPYSEIWLSPKPGDTGDTIKLALGTYGYRGIKEIIDDVKSANPDVQLDGYTERLMKKA